MKGLILSLDAMVAVAFMLTAILLISGMAFMPYAPRGAYLKGASLDALALIEKTGRPDLALGGNSTGIRRVLEATPDQICMHVSILRSDGDLVALIAKNNCGETGREVQVISRHFIYGNEPYIIRAETWQQRDSG